MLAATPAFADVKTREKGQVKLEGMLGTMMRMFGGKAANEGSVSTTALKGDRKATINDMTGRIVDLKEEKVYDLDMKKKTYTVTTFEELRRQLREAQERAAKEAKEAPKEGEKQQQQPSGQEKELDFDFDVKETGQTRSIAGYDARQVIMTLTIREKGKTLEESGGMVVTTDSWLGPEIPALKELAEFEVKSWKAIAPETAAMSAEQVAAVTAMYPMVKQAMERMNKEKVNMKGTSLASVLGLQRAAVPPANNRVFVDNVAIARRLPSITTLPAVEASFNQAFKHAFYVDANIPTAVTSFYTASRGVLGDRLSVPRYALLASESENAAEE